jgi:glycosyltransferase involved in cell wall biosynthesis
MLSRKPLVSVCLATYNQREYIRDAIASVLAQQTPHLFDIEIWVGDDGSTDGTSDVLEDLAKQYGDILKLITHQPNIGGTQNYQSLMRSATGDFVAHLDGDDYWLPGKIAAQLDFLICNPDCAAVYTAAIVLDRFGNLTGRFSDPQPEKFDIDYLMAKGNFLNHSSIFYRSSAINELVELIPPFIDYRIHRSMTKFGHLGYINKIYTAYRTGTTMSILRTMPSEFSELYVDTLIDAFPHISESTRVMAFATYFWIAFKSRFQGKRDASFNCRIARLLKHVNASKAKVVIALVTRFFCMALAGVHGFVARAAVSKRLWGTLHPRI